MSAPHLDTKPPVENATAPQEAPEKTPKTAQDALTTWWNHTLPPTARTIITQQVIALAVVLLTLPLASSLGWFGLHTATPSRSSNSTQTMSMSNQLSPNAPAHTLYNPQAPATPQGDVVNVSLSVKEALVSIAPGIAYQAWTFNGTVPGPVIRVRQGQTVHFTLTNNSKMSHSIDFHAAQTPWNVNYQPVALGASLTFDWVANYPGAFLYHCGTPPMMEHMANRMYYQFLA